MLKQAAKSAARGLLNVARQSPVIGPFVTGGNENPRISTSFSLCRVTGAIGKRLHEIPSQTTVGERELLYHYFRHLWSGMGSVIEIGPFLGGTTRAIACGMLHNPRRKPESLLYTFDRFEEYFQLSDLQTYLQPLVDQGVVEQESLRKLGERVPFIQLFEALHKHQDYYECIVPSHHGVPDLPDQVPHGSWMTLSDGCQTNAVFVDGCKSWFGTKYFMKLIAAAAGPGAIFLFQDYAWFTCFWLPAFIESFATHFSLVGNVDNTYGYCLNRPLSALEIEQYFPDTPQALGTLGLAKLIDAQIAAAKDRNDQYAVIRHSMQKAGALAYVGDLDQARVILRLVEQMPGANHHRSVLSSARKSPTYSPTGPILLDE